MTDRFRQLEIFVAVVDGRSLAGAARKLGVSAPVVTRAISDLEQKLGIRLLTRTTRVVRATDAGLRYAEDCRRILAELDEADESAGGVHRAPRGRLTVTGPALFGARHVLPVVLDYLRRYPDTSVACWFVDRVVNLVDEGADVAVRIGELPDSSANAIRVGAVRRIVCASPSYLRKHGVPRTPSDLARHSIISANAQSAAPEWRLMANGASRNTRVNPRLLTTTNDAAIVAALAGFGITLVLSYQVASELKAKRLVRVLEQCELPPLPVHVMHREGRRVSHKVRAFVDLAVEALRANPAIR